MKRSIVSTVVAVLATSLLGAVPAHAESNESESEDAKGGASSAAEPLEIGTDRPGAADGSGIVPTNHIQIETGFNSDFHPDGTQVQLADTLFRFGLHELLEARLFTSPFGLTATPEDGTETQPLGNLTLAAKIATPLGDDAAVGVLPFASLDDAAAPDRAWSGGGKLIADLGTSQPVSLTFNLGVSAVDRGDGVYGPEGFGSFVGNAALTESVGSFVEVYTIMPPRAEVATFVDGGVTYGITTLLQVDGWLGFEVAQRGSRFVGLGVSYLL